MGSSVISPAASRIIDSSVFFFPTKTFFVCLFVLGDRNRDREISRSLKAGKRAPGIVALEGEAFSHCFIRHYLNLATCGNFWGKLKRGDYVGGTQEN